MDRRTKILSGLLGLAVLYGLFSGVIYPRYIKKWLTLDERIAEKEAELERLNALEDRVNKARYEFRELAGRVGSFEFLHVDSDVRDRLNRMIAENKLQGAKVTPSRQVEDRKTGLKSIVISVSAASKLESAITFLRDVATLPHLARVGSVSISPASSAARRGLADDMVNIRVPIEIWVLPEQRVVGRIPPEDMIHPELYVRHHEGRDYSPIWTGEPFSEYVPLSAQANPTHNVQTGAPLTLEVSSTGGRGAHTFSWSPTDGLSNPNTPRPRVDTSEVGSKRYTVTVTDATGRSAQANVNVSVREPPKPPEPVVRADPPPVVAPPPDTRAKPWPDGQFKEIRMALLRRTSDASLDEFMLYDTRSRTNAYYKVGDEFDGGKLIYVHQTGGVAHRNGEYFVYPLGRTLQQSLPATAAGDFPELRRAAEYHRHAIEELNHAGEAGADGSIEDPTRDRAQTAAEAKRQTPGPRGKPPAESSREESKAGETPERPSPVPQRPPVVGRRPK